MSLETWLEEFYPITADDAVEKYVDELNLVEHSLQKWKGATQENLERHSCHYFNHYLTENGAEEGDPNKSIAFNGETCSLCVKYFEKVDLTDCGTCPIVVYTGKSCSEQWLDDGEYIKGHGTWSNSTDDPEPMIDLLQEVKDKIIESRT